ncbi:hypothetical protein FDP41_010299 [Naegleria fowleri]|uniref:Flavin-containing monooxygenase n=1 Tax=Naegleria fowleri TaxID=5763 RepID=A0A6A5C9L9_NAEFO|nr:uncharacterized protein FDP41_010299 [Naegleria fowleri]KAF0983234.1 hypothetical protein FDP41_010299 [Naegleria fowleri]
MSPRNESVLSCSQSTERSLLCHVMEWFWQTSLLIVRYVFHALYVITEWYDSNVSSSESNLFIPSTSRKFSKPSTVSPRRVCIIGAGVSGLIQLKTLLTDFSNIPFEVMCFEKGDHIGGLWKFDANKKDEQFSEFIHMDRASGLKMLSHDWENISPMYSSLHTNTSRDLMSFSDFPMNENLPDFPSVEQVYQYLRDYTQKFNLERYIQFKTEVIKLTQQSSHKNTVSSWVVTTRNVESGEITEREFDAVIIGNGRNSKPRIPSFFQDLSSTYNFGKLLHSKYYQDDYEIFKDKTVLIIGSGSSGSDIASRIALVTDKTFISVQKGAALLPKFHDGKPIDHNQIRRRYFQFLPKTLQTFLANYFINSKLPSSKQFYPFNHNTTRNHTVGLSSELIIEIGFGRVKVLPPVTSFSEMDISFENGKKLVPDYIVLCTGYELDFPFLDKEVLNMDKHCSMTTMLYEHMFHADQPNLIFLGLPFTVHPFLVCELQARYAAMVLSGLCSIPSRNEIIQANQNKISQLEKAGIDPIKFFHREFHLEYCDKIAKLGGFYANPFKFDHSRYFMDLMFGPLYGYHYRMEGIGKLELDEIERVMKMYQQRNKSA